MNGPFRTPTTDFIDVRELLAVHSLLRHYFETEAELKKVTDEIFYSWGVDEALQYKGEWLREDLDNIREELQRLVNHA